MQGILFSSNEDDNILKLSAYTEDSLTVISAVLMYKPLSCEFTEAACQLSDRNQIPLSSIYEGSPMDAVQNIWLDKKLKTIAENSNFNLDELLKEQDG